MARKKKSAEIESVNSLLSDLKNEITSGEGGGYIPDIIAFVEDPFYLGLPHRPSPVLLYPVQKMILKVFYRGSMGNETLKLNPEEIEMCERLGLFQAKENEWVENGDILGKYNSEDIFRELVLCWGRRSGKDFLISIVALYEAMRLLECEGGDPYALYNIASGMPISILTVASARHQARIAFQEIRDKLMLSPYFKDKIGPEGVEEGAIYLLTPSDVEFNKQMNEQRLPPKKGSVVIEVGNSNSDGLLGKGVFVLILDEVASYKSTGSSSSGERILSALTPSLNTYGRNFDAFDEDGNPILDDEGNQKINRIFDSKILSISSPRGKEGVFWDMYENAHNIKHRLMCRLPTWDVNTQQTKYSLLEANSEMNDEEFQMEFGAMFSGTAGESCFDRDSVESCFKFPELNNRTIGEPGKIYFAHLDPATSSNNYALVITHRENAINPETKKAEPVVIVDHVKFWQPDDDTPISIEEIDDYVIGLKRRFYLGLVTYDQMNSAASIQKMRKAGLRAKEMKYTRKYKMTIYKELEHMINSGRLHIPRTDRACEQLRNEMLHLQRKYDSTGFKVYPPQNKDGVTTDDLCDALAGAVWNTIASAVHSLPHGRIVETGVVPSSGNQMWQIGSGVAVGGAKQVTRMMERRNLYPPSQR